MSTRVDITGGNFSITQTGGGKDLNIKRDATCNISGGTVSVGNFTHLDEGGQMNMSAGSLTTVTLKQRDCGSVYSPRFYMTGGTLTTTKTGGDGLEMDGKGTSGCHPEFIVENGTVNITDRVNIKGTASVNTCKFQVDDGTVTIGGTFNNSSGSTTTILMSTAAPPISRERLPRLLPRMFSHKQAAPFNLITPVPGPMRELIPPREAKRFSTALPL
jgi:hypothetical protein